MNRARQTTLIALALLVVAFVATWLTVPTKRNQKVNPPASWFAVGGVAGYTPRIPRPPNQAPECGGARSGGRGQGYALLISVCSSAIPGHHHVDVAALERRVRFFYGGAAAVVIFVGLAFGAARASRPS